MHDGPVCYLLGINHAASNREPKTVVKQTQALGSVLGLHVSSGVMLGLVLETRFGYYIRSVTQQ